MQSAMSLSAPAGGTKSSLGLHPFSSASASASASTGAAAGKPVSLSDATMSTSFHTLESEPRHDASKTGLPGPGAGSTAGVGAAAGARGGASASSRAHASVATASRSGATRRSATRRLHDTDEMASWLAGDVYADEAFGAAVQEKRGGMQRSSRCVADGGGGDDDDDDDDNKGPLRLVDGHSTACLSVQAVLQMQLADAQLEAVRNRAAADLAQRKQRRLEEQLAAAVHPAPAVAPPAQPSGAGADAGAGSGAGTATAPSHTVFHATAACPGHPRIPGVLTTTPPLPTMPDARRATLLAVHLAAERNANWPLRRRVQALQQELDAVRSTYGAHALCTAPSSSLS